MNPQRDAATVMAEMGTDRSPAVTLDGVSPTLLEV